MKVIIGGMYRPTLDAATVTTTRAMSDPVPTCSLHLKDDTSSLKVQALQEILVLDEQMYSNPTANLLQNPNMSPYATHWNAGGSGNPTLAQNMGGGVTATFTNATIVPRFFMDQATTFGTVVPGVTYMLSCTVQGSSAVAVGANFQVLWLTASNQGNGSFSFDGAIPASGSAIRYSMSGVAPVGTVAADIRIGFDTSSSTNSGSITYTNIQFEPMWFPTIAYPTPFVGPNQTNCQQIAGTYWIRQYRKFAGFVTHTIAQDYHGNARTLQIDSVGYAWLMSTILANDSFSNQTDSAIISSLLSKYLLSYGATFISTTNVVTGVTMTSFGSNWDDLHTLFNNLAAQSAFYWTVDYYWNFIYAPPGYFAMMIALIADNSATPDLVTTFPVYNFSAEMDYTQPGSTILVIGSGSNVAEVIDGSTTAQNGLISGYSLPAGTSWMRKINDSSLQSVTDCTNRGMAEVLQYDYPRNLYHLTTNVELIAGDSIQVTSATDGLNATSLLIQKVQATWIGKSETLIDTWEYQADLGAANRAATHILSRLFRLANKNTSAPAISATTLALIEPIGVADSGATGTATTGYVQTIQADGPLAYYRLDEATGTIADDISGNMNQGTLHGTITLGVTGLLTSGGDTAMTFDGTTGYISLPTSLIPTGSGHAWSLECWCRVTSLPGSTWNSMVNMGTISAGTLAGIYINNTGGTVTFAVGTGSVNIFSSTHVATNTTYHVVGTYDGTNIRLYVNGSLVAGPSAVTVNLGTTYASIGADSSPAQEFFGGTIDEAAFYNYALSSGQVSNHYTVGTT